VIGHCFAQKQKKGSLAIVKNRMPVKKTEIEGENEFPGAQTGLKRQQPKSRFNPENKKYAYFIP
jgi:hypothetical protein